MRIGAGEQLNPDFLKLNPNARMPVIVDHAPDDGGEPITVIESGAIMMYLAEKSGQFLNYAPLGGDAGDLSYAQKRFSDEAHRIYGVLDYRLHGRQYIAGDEYTIADMICFPWTAAWENHPLELSEFENLSRWYEEVSSREAVQRGMVVGSDMAVNIKDFTPEEIEEIKKKLFNQRAIPLPG